MEEGTRGNCGSRKKLATAGRKMTHHTGVAWRKVHVIRKNQTKDKAGQGTSKRRMFGRRHQPKPERKSGIKDRGTRWQLHLKNKKTADRIVEKTFRLEVAT
jgi:hypothetical protein